MSERRRVCLLTGAGGTLGAEFCRTQAANYDIAAVYRSRVPPVASQHVRLVDPLGDGDQAENRHPVHAIAADLTRDEDVPRIVELALARFGQIDLLVNAAAQCVRAPLLASHVGLQALDAQLRVNVAAPLRLAVEVARRAWRDEPLENRARRRGVVNVSCTAGLVAFPGQGLGVYSATKAALNQASVHLAQELDQIGVRVNALAPAAFPRVLTTRSVVDAVVRLDEATFSGRVVVLDPNGETFVDLTEPVHRRAAAEAQ